MKSLDEYRVEIDALDQQLLKCIAARVEVCKKVAEYKRNNNIPMMQPDRVKTVLENVCRSAEKYGLSADLIKKIYAEMHAEIFKIEDEIIDAH